jgi:hypothetical protein
LVYQVRVKAGILDKEKHEITLTLRLPSLNTCSGKLVMRITHSEPLGVSSRLSTPPGPPHILQKGKVLLPRRERATKVQAMERKFFEG